MTTITFGDAMRVGRYLLARVFGTCVSKESNLGTKIAIRSKTAMPKCSAKLISHKHFNETKVLGNHSRPIDS